MEETGGYAPVLDVDSGGADQVVPNAVPVPALHLSYIQAKDEDKDKDKDIKTKQRHVNTIVRAEQTTNLRRETQLSKARRLED